MTMGLFSLTIKIVVMKPVLFSVAFFLCLSVAAQQKKNVSLSQSINDDGKTLSIKIKGTADGNPVDFDKSYDISGMSKAQKDALKEHVYDSLGLQAPIAPRPPIAPRAPLTLIAPAEPSSIDAPTPPTPPIISSKNQYSEFYSVGGEHPYTKEIKYNPKTGLLYMKYRFIKNGEETTVEKSIDAKDKTKDEREEIIKKYEREIGVAQPEMI